MVVPVAVHVVEDLEYVRSHRDRSSPVGPSDPIRPGPLLLRGRTVVVGEKEEECTRTLIMMMTNNETRRAVGLSPSLSHARSARAHTHCS